MICCCAIICCWASICWYIIICCGVIIGFGYCIAGGCIMPCIGCGCRVIMPVIGWGGCGSPLGAGGGENAFTYALSCGASGSCGAGGTGGLLGCGTVTVGTGIYIGPP